MLKKICTDLIKSYQKYISPHKGFSCAHKVLCGTESCSVYGLRQFQTKGFFEAYSSTRCRMQECSKVYKNHTLTLPQEKQNLAKRKKLLLVIKIINPVTYFFIIKRFVIINWPKTNKGVNAK